MTLLWMKTICLHIPQIIETVDTTRNKTERGEHHKCGPEEIWLQQVVAEENRRKDENILKPLQRTEKSNIFNHCCKDNANFRFSEEKTYYFAFLSMTDLSK